MQLIDRYRTISAAWMAALPAVLAVMPIATAQDLLDRWAARAARVDSLYVEGRFVHYRVPADRDAADPDNWTIRPEVCPVSEFALWLRRPDFRVNVRVVPRDDRGPEAFEQHFGWVDKKLYARGIPKDPSERRSGCINKRSRQTVLSVEPYLTPVEYHFFDWWEDNVPALCRSKPHHEEGNAVIIQFSSEKDARWVGRIEFDPAQEYCPRRMSLLLMFGDDAGSTSWDLETLETQKVGGVPVISKARIVLYNPRVNPAERVVYLWETTRIEQRAITRADLEVVFPPGTPVMDYTTNKEWIEGDPDSVQDIDLEALHEVAQALQAQLVSPEIRARRSTAMRWIIVGAAALTLLLGGLAYRIRQLHRESAR
jgi:hypothetical protein